MIIRIFLFLFMLLSANISFAAVSFTTTGTDSLSCGTNDDILTENGAMTISAWVNLAQDTANGGDPKILLRDNNSTGIVMLSVSTTKKFYFFVNGSTALSRFTSNNAWVANTWTNVIVTWDGSTTATNIHIYVNGVEASYSSTTNGISIVDDSASTFFIGNEFDGLRPAAGKVSQVAIWNRVLTGTEITNISSKMNVDINAYANSGLKRWFRLNECPDGVSCSGAGQFKDLSASAVNCAGANNPKGFSSPVSNIANGTVYNGTIN